MAGQHRFDYFYGFVGGDANQWQPNLFRNTTANYPYNNNPGWNLTTAMADNAIEYMRRVTGDPLFGGRRGEKQTIKFFQKKIRFGLRGLEWVVS